MKQLKEIDLVVLFTKVLKRPKPLMTFIGSFAIMGIIVALNKPKTYTSTVILAPELSSGSMGLNGGLADMASSFGLDLKEPGNSIDAIYPELYPEIFSSTDFIRSLFNVSVRLKKDNKQETYIQHITKDKTIPFWNYPVAFIAKILSHEDTKTSSKSINDPFKISKDDNNNCNTIRKSIACLVDKKTSVITINVTDQDPLVAAILADTLQHRLQEYITNYRTQKARNDYEYTLKLFRDAQAQYTKSRQQYASFGDANTDLIVESYKLKQEDLENDMQLKYNIYSQLLTKLQDAKAKIQERTPAFTIIEKPIMPYKASSTPRSMTVIMFMFFGALLDVIWILFGDKMLILTQRNKDKVEKK